MLFDRHPEFRRKNGGRNFWARGYYVTTVGNVNASTIVNYIREQEENDKLENCLETWLRVAFGGTEKCPGRG